MIDMGKTNTKHNKDINHLPLANHLEKAGAGNGHFGGGGIRNNQGTVQAPRCGSEPVSQKLA